MSQIQLAALETIFFIPQMFIYTYFFSSVLTCKFSKQKMVFIFFCTSIMYWFGIYLNRAGFFMYAIGFIGLNLWMLMFKDKIRIRFLALGVLCLVCMITNQVALLFMAMLNIDPQTAYYLSVERYVGMMLAAVIMFPLMMFASVIWNRTKKLITPRYILSAVFLPFVQLLLLSLSIIAQNGVLDLRNIILIFLNQTIFIILECLQFSAVKNSIAYQKQQQELQAYQQKSEMDYQFYKLTETHMQTISQMRHDIHNQISAIRGLISEKNLELAGELSRSLSDELKAMRPLKYCENTVVNTVVTIKQQEAQESDIYTSFQLNDTSKLSLASHTLCSLFTNLLDNAIESCKKCPGDIEKRIKLTTGVCSGQMVINMENSTVDVDLDATSEIPNTTKIEDVHSHGLGMKIIKKIVDESNGSFQYQRNNGIFKITVIIPTEETNI